MVAPRINAAGRMSTPDIATRLLLASDEGDGRRGARRSPSSSKPRTPAAAPEDQDIVAKAKKIVETDPEVGSRSVLVVAGEGWHRGVIGIVASKLVDAFYRPAIVLSIDGDIAHGSCRSIAGFNMLAALESCAPLMKRFGGHKAAAGLQIESVAHQGVPPGGQRARRRAASAPTISARRSGSTARSRSTTSTIG